MKATDKNNKLQTINKLRRKLFKKHDTCEMQSEIMNSQTH